MSNKVLKIGIFIIFFLILSEKITFINITFAVLVSFIVFKFNNDDGRYKKYMSFKLITLYLEFIATLLYEIVISNIEVAKIALSKNMNISPNVIEYESLLTDEFLLVTFANSITLTPGTMSVDIDSNVIKVHCLNSNYNVKNMKIEKILLEIEGEINA